MIEHHQDAGGEKERSPASAEESSYLQIGRAGKASAAGGAVAFRSCVYQPAADFVVRDGGELKNRLRDFIPPAQCPFPID